ncbi:MAG: hypothetical protein EBS05_01245 [Proteobacteria bacterium]|nr:hypothetical protein [Pseudomonadota bacterium]
MNAHVEELAKEIRSLPEEARTYLLDQIMESLEVAEVERAWQVELDRREADIESGRAPLLDGEKVMAELQAVAREWRRE